MGLKALIPGLLCAQLRFSDSHLPDIIREAERVLLVVDSRIFFQGEWSALSALKSERPDASTIWLVREETGRLFPEEGRSDWILAQKIDVAEMHLAIKKILCGFYEGEHAGNIELTNTERSLLPYFVSGLSMNIISRLTNKSDKTLYTHRQRIMTKAGFRLPAFFQFVHIRNQGVTGYSGLSAKL